MKILLDTQSITWTHLTKYKENFTPLALHHRVQHFCTTYAFFDFYEHHAK